MTQVHPGGTTAAVPLEVSQLATAQGLGAHRATFAPNKRWRLIISVGVLVLIFGLLTLGIGVSSMSSTDSPSPAAVWSTVAVVELVLIGLFLWPLLTSPVMSAKARARQFYVFEYGLVHVGAKSTQAYRFDAVADVIAAVVSTTYNGISAGTNYKYEVRFGDGRVLKLQHVLNGHGAIRAAAADRDRQRPAAPILGCSRRRTRARFQPVHHLVERHRDGEQANGAVVTDQGSAGRRRPGERIAGR
jgi:hypothetical protein